MRRTLVLSFLILSGACSSPSDPVTAKEDGATPAALVASFPQVFVLGAADGIAAEPVTTFDHTCQGIRYVHTVRDSVVLNPDGTALRSVRLDRAADRSPLDSSIMIARGSWRRITNTRNMYYFNQAPSIELTLTWDNSRVPTYTMPLRLDGSNELSYMGAMGGSCPGSANDARDAKFSYTRR